MREHQVSEPVRLRLYNAFVLPHLLYNIGTQGFTAEHERKLDAFHRKQLRQVLRIFYPEVISNEALYKRTNCGPLSDKAREARWKLFGHILRLPPDVPANKAMEAYFRASSVYARRPAKPRTCLAYALQMDLAQAQVANPNMPEQASPTEFTCEGCQRSFSNSRGLRAHQSHWCSLSTLQARSLAGPSRPMVGPSPVLMLKDLDDLETLRAVAADWKGWKQLVKELTMRGRKSRKSSTST